MKMLGRMALFGIVTMLVGVLGLVRTGQAAAPLKTPPGAVAEAHNAEGIEQYNQGHWKTASEHFEQAVDADPNSAEAHYNLALALDKMGQHMDAARQFKRAADLGKDNPAIQNSRILKAHLKMLPGEPSNAPPSAPAIIQIN